MDESHSFVTFNKLFYKIIMTTTNFEKKKKKKKGRIGCSSLLSLEFECEESFNKGVSV